MALSDCLKCWETPCICGYEYRNLDKERRIKLASVILGINEKELLKTNIPKYHPKRDKTNAENYT